MGPATVMSRPGTVITGSQIPVPVGVSRWRRSGYATGARAWTRGTPCARLAFVPSGSAGAQLMDGRPLRGEGGWPGRGTRRGDGRGSRFGGPGLSRAATLHVGMPKLPCAVRGRRGRLLRGRRDILRV